MNMAGDAPDHKCHEAGSPELTRGPDTTETLLRTLRRCKLFASVSGRELRTILSLGRERYFANRATVFCQGGRAESIYVVIQGKVKLLLNGPSGRGIILTFVGPGETFGYLDPMARGTTRAYSALAVEESRVLEWPAKTVEEIIKHHPAVARDALRLTAQQLKTGCIRLHDLVSEPVARRLARAILRLAPASAHRTAPDLIMTQQDLADYLGTTPPTLSRIFGRWKTRGLVTSGRQRIVIKHPDDLARIAGPD